GGCMTEEYLLGLIPEIQADFVEIFSHPKIAEAREQKHRSWGMGQAELNALLSPKVSEILVKSGFELTNYNQRVPLSWN
ncbi:MAG: hypothetical protein PUP92_17540, partial [Rhizonema sp. PD38]|nr:hypothetical protein [Rhizonema sp. PD38]